MQTYRGKLVNNMGKLRTLDENIAAEEAKLRDLPQDDVENKRAIESRLRSLREERASRLEVTSENSKALRSQINRIKETISQILTGDTTLAKRIRTLFREQGITIFSLVTALGLASSTIVLAIKGGGRCGGGSSSTPAQMPPTNGGGVKEWIQNKLKSLGNM